MLETVSRKLQHNTDWQTLSTINAYRCLIAAGLVGMRFSPFLITVVDIKLAALFNTASILYLICGALSVLCTMVHRPQLTRQVELFNAADIAFIALLCFAGPGVNSGLGALLLVPVACVGALLTRRTALLFAALAALALLFQEAMRLVMFPQAGAALLPAFILAGLFLVFAGSAHWLGQRVRRSEGKVAEHSRTLRDLYALNERIIERMSMGTVAVDEQHRIQLTNAAALHLLQIPQTPDHGTPLRSVSASLSDALDDWLRSREDSTRTIAAGDHTLLPAFSALPSFAAETGGAMPVLIFLEDAARQNEQAQQLKLAALGRLSAGIAHEIRNPLSAINHATQLLAESSALSGDDRNLLDIIQRHSRRIDDIVDDVMGLARQGSTEAPPMQLKPWLEETMGEYRQLSEQPPELSLRDVDAERTIRFNPPHLRRVLFNLWQNAEHHARRGDDALQVTLSGHQDDNDVFCLDVADNGPGFGDDQGAQILEPLFTTGDGGIGLGLHIARELCESNGAQLVPAAGGSGGACFRIRFTRPMNA